MRKLLLGLLLLLLVAPASSNSVGLGEVRLESYLNQPLRAEVPVRGAAAAGESLQIRHAAEDAYRRAGLNRGGVPGDLNIQLVGEGANQRVLLTTRQPVREPYVGVLLEARWDGGRTLREITLLLDPPGTLPADTAAPVMTPAERAPDVRAPDAGETYQVRSGDTLYRIVERSGISGVSMNQAMLAFLRANPQAFADDNINSLLAGAELRVPSPAELDAVSTAEASAEVRAQTEAWRDRTRAAAAPEAPAAPAGAEAEAEAASPEEPAVVADEVAVEDELAVDEETAVDDAVAMEEEVAVGEEVAAAEADAEAAAAAEDRLEIVTELLPETEEGVATDPASPDLLQEALLSQRAEMEGMRDELADLREALGERGRLAELSSEGMAELEEQLRALRAERNQLMARLDRAEAAREAPLHERVMNDPLLLMMAIALLVLLLLVLLVFARGGRREVMIDERVAGMGPRADNRNVRAESPGDAGYRAEEISSAKAGAAVATAAGAGMVVGEAKREDEDADLGSPVAEAPAATAEAEESVGEARVAETAGGSPSAQDDVLAEVDVCLAYGMNDQAVETLTDALQTDPDNRQYRLKLVESYLALGDAGAARQAATDLHARLGPDDDATRDRLAELESQMVDMPAADADEAGGDDGARAPEGTADAVPESSTEAESASADEEDFGGMDFSGFDIPETEEEPGADQAAGAEDKGAVADTDDSGLSFDIDDSLDEDLATAAQSLESAPEEEDSDLGGLSFDIKEDDLPKLDDGDADEAPESAAPTDLDLPSIEESAEDLEQPVSGTESGEAEPEPGQAAGEEATEADENETRLSLAQAYVDMGDEDGAKELLDEIAATGSDEQKRQADAIREQLQS